MSSHPKLAITDATNLTLSDDSSEQNENEAPVIGWMNEPMHQGIPQASVDIPSIGVDVDTEFPSPTSTITTRSMVSLTTTIPSTSSVFEEISPTMNTNENKRPRGGVKHDDDEEEEGVMKMKAQVPMVNDGTDTISSLGTSIVTEDALAIANIAHTASTNDKNTVHRISLDHTTAIEKRPGVGTSTTTKKQKTSHNDTVEENMAQTSKGRKGNANLLKWSAPSVTAYLRLRGVHTTTNETPALKYLPRPEWCGIPIFLLQAELGQLKNKYNINFAKVVDMSVNDYETHLKQYVTNRINARTDGDLEMDASNDTIQEKVDFVSTYLQSHLVYFDVNNYLWRTCKKPNRSDDGDLQYDAFWSSTDHICHVTYEMLIQERHLAKQSIGGKTGSTILHLAIEKNATNVALDIIRLEYNTFLDCVRRIDDLKECLGLITLLETANNKEYTPLILAAQKGNIKIVEALLNCGVSIHGVTPNPRTGSLQPTAIMQAAQFGQIHVIEFMIQYYESHKVTRSIGPNPAFWPKSVGHLVDECNKNWTTPMMRAAQAGHVSIVKLLVEHDADGDGQNKFGMTPLMFAAQSGHADVCRTLIEYGSDIDFLSTPHTELTALLLACKHGHVDVVREFVRAGCNLYHKNDHGRTAQQEISLLIILRRVASEAPLSVQNRIQNRQRANIRRRANDSRNLDAIDGGDVEGDYMDIVPIESYQKIVHLLNPHVQVDLMQFTARTKRNFVITHMHTLIQQNRAGIKISDGTTYDVTTAVGMLTKMQKNSNGSGSNTSTSPSPEDPQHDPKLESHMSALTSSKQMLLRTMLLPAPLVQMISQLLPTPLSFVERMQHLEHSILAEDPNTAISLTLDIIDEVLEEGGFLSACDAAQIPAPVPHRTWCNWKQNTKARATWDDDLEEDLHDRPRLSVTLCTPPSPRDKSHPTISEQRRLVGYTSLLSKYESSTNIVTILSEEPYGIPRRLIDQLIRVADIASLCRRCDEIQGIQFNSDVASDLVELADDLFVWCVRN